ncbi:unnamed protein product [Hyaloperonospora brassicae]|uniref:Anaphase-promoting complex subunit 4 WD40 domain-containing protein n=1 Tax=Hyaloperonospora brassicae TaxID=162125 RepID=A0AAV0V4G8_HYABA|nr:unnamed protein product [Hyaloperonospora brassicae]
MTVAWPAPQTLPAHARAVSSLAFAPNETLLASSSADSSVKIWQLPSECDASTTGTTALKTSLYGHEAGVSDCCWSPDARHVASASDDWTARLWDVETAKTLATLGAAHRSLDAALWTPLSLLKGPSGPMKLDEDGLHTAVVAADAAAESHTGFVNCVAFNPQGSLVATGSHDESLRLWDVRSGKTVAVIGAHQEPVVSVQFHPTDGSLLVSGGYDGLVRVWDVASRQCMRSIITEPAAPVGSVRFTPNGRYVLSSTLDGTLRLWDYVRDVCVRSYSGHMNRKFGMQCVFLQQHDKQPVVVCGSEDHRIFVWDVASQEVVSVLAGQDYPVLALAAHPTRALMVSSSNQDIKVWTPSDEADGNGDR